MDLGIGTGQGGLTFWEACKVDEEDWIPNMGFRQSRRRNERGRKGGVGRGPGGQQRERESLQNVRLKGDGSGRKSVTRMGATNPTLPNHG